MLAITQQRHVIMRGKVYRWEEKQPFAMSGRSLHGALEYDRQTDTVQCHECGEWHSYLGNHIAHYHPELTAREYKFKHGLTARHSLLGEQAAMNLRNRKYGEISPHASLLAYREMVERGEKDPPRVVSSVHRNTAALRNQRNICKDQCLFRLQALIVELDHVPFDNDIPRNLRDNLRLHYGSPRNALKVLGIEPNQIAFTKDILIESLRDFYVLNQRLPRRRDWGIGRLCTAKTYQNHFGSISASYEAAGLALVAARQRAAAWTANLKPATPEQVSNAQKKIWAKRTPAQRFRFMGELAKRRWAGMSPEERAESVQRMQRHRAAQFALLSPEERAARIQRMNEARAQKQLNRKTAVTATA